MPTSAPIGTPAAPATDMLTGILNASLNGIMAYQAVRADQQGASVIVDFQILQYNRVAERMLSLPSGAIGQRLLTLFPGVKTAGLFDRYVAVVETGEPLRSEVPYHSEGIDGWFDIAVVKLNDGFVITFLDITASRRAMQQGQERQQLLDGVLETSPNGIIVYEAIRDAPGNVVDFRAVLMNRATTLLSGQSEADIRAKTMLQRYPKTKESGLFDHYVRLIETGEPFTREIYEAERDVWYTFSAARLGDGFVLNFTNLTDVKRAELRKRDQAALLDGILNTSMNGIAAVRAVRDAAGRIDDFVLEVFNQALTATSSIGADQLRGQRIAQLDPALKPSGLFDHYVAVCETGEPYAGEYFYPARGRWFRVAVARQQPDRLVITVTDISEVKLAAQRLEEQTQLLSQVLNNSLNGIMSFAVVRNEAGTVVDLLIETANQTAATFLQRPVEELIGRKLVELYPVHIDVGLFDFYRATLLAQQARREVRFMVIDGYELWLDVAAAPLPDGLVVTFLDVTETKKAQQALLSEATLFETLTKHVPDTGVLVCSPGSGLRVLYANGELPAIFTTDTLVGQHLPAVMLPAWRSLLTNAFTDALSGQSRQLEADINGQTYALYCTPVYNAEPQLIMAMATFRNVTQDRRFQQQLETSVRELQKSNANLEQFAYVASHDLQEPLRKIQGFGDVLRTQYDSALGTTGIDLIARMQSAAGRMQVLIRDLLAYSRLARTAAEPALVSLSALLNDVLSDLETAVLDRQAEVVAEPLPSVPGDALQLRQLLQNLLSNALKFTRPGVPPRIRVTGATVHGRDVVPLVPAERATEQFCRIDVSDNGIGFDPKHTDRIFQVFQRLHGRQQYAGTGIGLAIVHKVVENHQGYITAEGRPNQGATFTVLLPTTFSVKNNPLI